jgi:hypothetical protein
MSELGYDYARAGLYFNICKKQGMFLWGNWEWANVFE